MKNNRLRELLDADKPTLGTHLITPWPGMAEVIAGTGVFDYIEYVGEYSPFSVELLDNLGRAFELFPEMSSMMKVEEQSRGFIATRSIDAGIQNVLFTDCRSAAEAKECIDLVRPETPEAGGNHGAGMRRNVGYVSYAASEKWVQAMNDVVIAIMIEKKGAMENLDEILALKGVDMVQFGPADYSISVGKTGQAGSPEIQAVQKVMIEKALAAGVAPRVEIADFHQAQPFIDMGVKHFCIGWDLGIIAQWCHKQGPALRELLTT